MSDVDHISGQVLGDLLCYDLRYVMICYDRQLQINMVKVGHILSLTCISKPGYIVL